MKPGLGASSYDQIAYPFAAHANTHPMRIAARAQIEGLEAPDPHRCRVLEIGCAGGGNLLPMAESLPDSRFVGIDLSEAQIHTARQAAAQTGLTRVEFLCLDLLQADRSLGEFDYILANGIYSWVPAPVRARLLELCHELLAPNGIAFISYNTLPGWEKRLDLRQILLAHIARLEDPIDRLEAALSLLQKLKLLPEVAETAVLMEPRSFHPEELGYWYHEYLDEFNSPLLFGDFLSQLDQHELAYLGDAEGYLMHPFDLSPERALELDAPFLSPLELEAELDMLRRRSFRESLVCPKQAVRNAGTLQERFEELTLSAALPPVTRVDLRPGVSMGFEAGVGTVFILTDPVKKAALLCLAEQREPFRFDELVDAALRKISGQGLELGDRQAATKMTADLLWSISVSSPHLRVSRFDRPEITGAPDRPEVLRTARFAARLGARTVANRYHRRVLLDELDRELMPLLDGTRNVGKLDAQAQKKVEEYRLSALLL